MSEQQAVERGVSPGGPIDTVVLKVSWRRAVLVGVLVGAAWFGVFVLGRALDGVTVGFCVFMAVAMVPVQLMVGLRWQHLPLASNWKAAMILPMWWISFALVVSFMPASSSDLAPAVIGALLVGAAFAVVAHSITVVADQTGIRWASSLSTAAMPWTDIVAVTSRRTGIQMKTTSGSHGVAPLLTHGHPVEVRSIVDLWQASTSSTGVHRALEHRGE